MNKSKAPNIEHTGERIEQLEPQEQLKAYKIGSIGLTITTIILVIISLCFGGSFAPFIILLMSSRIGTSIYIIIKTNARKEIGKLVLWIALLGKSCASYSQILIGMA